MNKRSVYLLSMGHLVADLNQGAIPAMLPFLIARHDMTYAAAAGILFAANITSTIVQPIFGHLADRISRTWMMPLSLLLAGFGVAMIGMAESYSLKLLLAGISGIGIAAYHPEAARRVNLLAGDKKAAAMGIFGIGGALGFSIGPLYITFALLWFDLPGTLLLLAPVGLVAALIAKFLPNVQPSTGSALKKDEREEQDAWRPFALLSLSVTTRSVFFFGMLTFIPLYWVHVLGQTAASGGIALSVMTLAGVLGTLFGGRMADRFGNARILLAGFSLLAPLTIMLIRAGTPAAALLAVMPLGFVLMTTYAPSIVLAQKYLPNHIGFSSGITLGIAVAAGGIAAPFLGRAADVYGIVTVLTAMACLPLINMVIAFFLPEPRAHSRGHHQKTRSPH
jgi:MFS transporter, FSR family, fosmidomycin resistance protein